MNEDDDESDSNDELMPQEWMNTDFGHRVMGLQRE
jgi:hypothetical protein